MFASKQFSNKRYRSVLLRTALSYQMTSDKTYCWKKKPLDMPVLSWDGVFWVIQAFQPCVAVVWASVVVGLAVGYARVLALAGATWLSCRQQAWLASVEDMPVPTLGLGWGKKISAGC